jgi:hypothetical protein
LTVASLLRAGFTLRGWIRGPSLLIAAEEPHGVFSGKKVMAEELFPFAIGGHPVLPGGPQAAAPGQERQVGLDGPTVILKRPWGVTGIACRIIMPGYGRPS